MTDLSGRVALVTGASAPHGIGRAIALHLSQAGAKVVVTDRPDEDGTHVRQDLLRNLVGDITTNGGIAAHAVMDVTCAGDITGVVDEMSARLGTLNILVNNAGSLAGTGDFMGTSPDQWQQSFEVNVLGPMCLCQAVIPGMQAAGGGRIINIGSTGSLGAEAGFGAYTAMKHALVGMTKTLAAEFGADSILCNTVCPGFIDTDMHAAANQRLAAEVDITLEQMKATRYANVALRRAGAPEDVARVVTFLAGPGGDYITGVSLPVSGGTPVGL